MCNVCQVFGSLGQHIDHAYDVPAGLLEGFDERPTDVGVRVERESAGH
jgi:hypothetical protein